MAASSFERSVQYVLTHEGGYTNHPSDPGGPTNWGITLHDARLYWKRNASALDVRAMPLSVAKQIYRERYWNALRCDELPLGVDYALFDYGVNSGVGRARKVLMRIVAARMPDAKLADVFSAAGKIAADRLIRDLCAERRAFLRGLKTWPVFGRGWARRVMEVEANALALARGARENAVRVSTPAIIPGNVQGRGKIPTSPHAQAAGAGAAISIGAGAAMFASNWIWILVLIAGGILGALVIVLALRFYRAWRQHRVAAIHTDEE